jgi:short-subunit dehydrogenase
MKKIWLIGASEGIGRAVARELGKNVDNSLILSARNEERLLDLSSELEASSIICPLDVGDSQSVEDCWKEIVNKKTTIDTIIYCAGYYAPMTAENIDVAQIEKMINVNLVGAVRVLSQAVPEFIGKKSGHIVLISSIAGYRGLPNDTGYGSSKSGLIHLAENLNCDLSEYGIKVQLISPGFVRTRLTDLNNFRMPSLMSTEQAAKHIVKAIESKHFEIRFPFLFANCLKLLSLLPYSVYFWLMRKIRARLK